MNDFIKKLDLILFEGKVEPLAPREAAKHIKRALKSIIPEISVEENPHALEVSSPIWPEDPEDRRTMSSRPELRDLAPYKKDIERVAKKYGYELGSGRGGHMFLFPSRTKGSKYRFRPQTNTLYHVTSADMSVIKKRGIMPSKPREGGTGLQRNYFFDTLQAAKQFRENAQEGWFCQLDAADDVFCDPNADYNIIEIDVTGLKINFYIDQEFGKGEHGSSGEFFDEWDEEKIIGRAFWTYSRVPPQAITSVLRDEPED